MQEAGMTQVAGCPFVAPPHMHRYRSFSARASSVKAKTTFLFRIFINSLSGTSLPLLALGTSLPLLALGAMAAEEKQEVRSNGSTAVASKGESSNSDLGKKRGTTVLRLGEAEKVNEQCPCDFSFLWGRCGPTLYHLLRDDACVPRPSHARPPRHVLDGGCGEAQLTEKLWRFASAMPTRALL